MPGGNTNALRHGFYSRWFTRQEHHHLDQDYLGQLNDEENGLLIILDLIFKAMDSEKLSLDQLLAASRAISLAVGRIESIQRSRKAVYDTQTSLEQALDELKMIPLEDD